MHGPVGAMAQHLLPWARLSLVLVVPSGLMMFAAHATELAENPAFRLKPVLIGSALLDAAAFHKGALMSVGTWNQDAKTPKAAKLAAVFSLVLWTGAITCGRLLAYQGHGGGVLGLLFMAILAPIAATLIQLAISRSREYFADSTGAGIAGSASGLARALEKLHYASQQLPMEADPATAHLFIVNPLSGASLSALFSTHPPIEERIRRLRGLSPVRG